MKVGIITGTGTYALTGLGAGASEPVETRFGEALVAARARSATPRCSTSPATARDTVASRTTSPTAPTSRRCRNSAPRR